MGNFLVRSTYLSSGLSGCLGLGGHGALELNRESDVLSVSGKERRGKRGNLISSVRGREGCAAEYFSVADSHLDPLGLDAPGIRGLVERVLHDLADGLALGEDLGEVLGAQHVPEGGRR